MVNIHLDDWPSLIDRHRPQKLRLKSSLVTDNIPAVSVGAPFVTVTISFSTRLDLIFGLLMATLKPNTESFAASLCLLT